MMRDAQKDCRSKIQINISRQGARLSVLSAACLSCCGNFECECPAGYDLPPMGLFKSAEERRIEQQMKIRQGIRSIEKSIQQQGRFSEDFIKNAQQAKKIGDNQQYLFIRSALKKTATIKKMLERQLLAIKNAMLIH